jgi:glycosyltransferase involved in cell wall biosynthesis
MTSPLVSVVVPTYARPDRLQSCLAALYKQVFCAPWEIVIIDDGSPEPIQYGKANRGETTVFQPRVRIVRQENAGPAAARNHGVAIAKGIVIAFTDDDCQPEPTWLEQLFQRWQLNPRAMVGGTTLNALLRNPFSTTSQLIIDLVYQYFNADPDDAYFLASNNALCSRQQFLAIGGFDLSFPRPGAEDRDFCDRWRQQNWPLIWQQQAYVVHFHHQNLQGFVGLHVRYGRGAFLYQYKRTLRQSGSFSEDLGFHRVLLPLLFHRWRRNKSNAGWPLIWVNLVIWQLANAYGFFIELKDVNLRSLKITLLSLVGHRRVS